MARLRRARRVREVFVLRGHTHGCGWSYLAAVAAQIRARLTLVVHEPQPRPYMVDCLRLDGVRVLAPRGAAVAQA